MAEQSVEFVDQVSGKTLAIRPDITPQIARIESHRLQEQGITRLCYVGDVLKAKPNVTTQSRQPIQLGAELYGTQSLQADLEILHLLLTGMAQYFANQLHLVLGHHGLFQALVAPLQLTPYAYDRLVKIIQSKSKPDLYLWLAENPLDKKTSRLFEKYLSWQEEPQVLYEKLKDEELPEALWRPLEDLHRLTEQLQSLHPEVSLFWDLSDIRGHRYHTGIVFTLYHSEQESRLARGGRYDAVGETFGRARPATGFTMDLRSLLPLIEVKENTDQWVMVDAQFWIEAQDEIQKLRQQGYRVTQGFAESSLELVTHKLIQGPDGWQLQSI